MGKESVDVEIRKIEDLRGLKACEHLQEVVWGFSPTHVVPASVLKTSCDFGGLVLGAFDEQKSLLGFCYSFPVLWGNSRTQHSHMLAVLPAVRDLGLGYRLKRAQFESLRSFCRFVTWTFDPLESKNGFLNLNKLGAKVRRYFVDFYGPGSTSALHQGIGTDRFLAECDIRDENRPADTIPVASEFLPYGLKPIHCNRSSSGQVKPESLNLDDGPPEVYVEVPSDIQRLKIQNVEMAQRWRMLTRQAFQFYFERGYESDGLIRDLAAGKDGARCYYRLVRR